MRDINIKAVTNGFIVTVGCRTVVFETAKTLLRELEKYLDNPVKVEAEYLKDEKYPSSVPPQPATVCENRNTVGSVGSPSNQGITLR